MDTRGINDLLIQNDYQQTSESNPPAAKTSPDSLTFLPAFTLREIIKEVGPRVYKIDVPEQEESSFYVFGCQGSGNHSQHLTAKFMDEMLAKDQGTKPAFILVLGDNVYDYGASSPEDAGFKACFDDIYGNPELSQPSKLPYFMILGNHDGNFHAKSWFSKNPVGEETEIQEVMHTYHKDPEYLRKIFLQEKLEPSSLPQWNMPYFFYSIIHGDMQIFCVDSNTILKDYIAYKTNKANPNKPNQFYWLKKEFENAKAAGRKCAVAQHHPRYTAGKRAFPEKYDSHHYLTADEIEMLKKLLDTDSISTNTMIAEAYSQEGLEFDIDFAAHDHYISYYNTRLGTDNNKKICLLTVGGGGGDLEERKSFSGYPYVATHLSQNGFAKIVYKTKSPRDIFINIHTTEGHHLTFTQHSHAPIRTASSDKQVEELRMQTLAICNKYVSELKRKEEMTQTAPKTVARKEASQSTSRGFLPNLFGNMSGIGSTIYHHAWNYMSYDKTRSHEVVYIHNLEAYLNQPSVISFDDAIKKMMVYTAKLISNIGTETPLINELEAMLQSNFSQSLKIPTSEQTLNA